MTTLFKPISNDSSLLQERRSQDVQFVSAHHRPLTRFRSKTSALTCVPLRIKSMVDKKCRYHSSTPPFVAMNRKEAHGRKHSDGSGQSKTIASRASLQHHPHYAGTSTNSSSAKVDLASSGLSLLRDSVSPSDHHTRSYRLEIVQHPVKTAEFTSTLTRLPLAPPLIAQLHIMDDTAKGNTTDDNVGSPREHSSSPPQRLLYGNLVSSPHILLNLHGRQGVYFLFPDVSIRYQGRYLLSVTLLKLPGMGFGGPTEMSNEGMVLARAQTLPFDVLPRENYVAPVQTPLTQYFLQQGARMTTGSSGLRRC
ncbi:hypothetical protein ABKN59_010171 [Abortiporus biennis]